MRSFCVLLTSTFGWFFALTLAQTMDNSIQLYETLMTGYKKSIRPAVEQTKPISVQFEFDIISIREVDEIVGKLSIIGVVYLRWEDPRLSWNPYLHNGTYMINIPQEEVWKPDLIVGYPIDAVKAVGFDHHWIYVRYFYNGTAKYAPGDVLNAACQIDVEFYPFDTQSCQIYFLPWAILSSEIEFYTPTLDVYKRYFTEHGEWSLEEATTVSGLMYELYPSVILNIRIRRRSSFVIVNVILPILNMGFLNILVFWLPAQSGERVSFAITVLLAIAVFLTLVVDNLPKTSQPMSTICYFLLTNLVLSSLIMFFTIFNLSVYYRSEQKPKSRWLLCLTEKLVRKKSCKENSEQITEVTEIEISHDTPENKPEKKRMRARGSNASVWDVQSSSSTDDVTITWHDVSIALDRFATILSFIWLAGSTVAFFIMVVTQKVPGLKQ